jgi:hypothetical protein
MRQPWGGGHCPQALYERTPKFRCPFFVFAIGVFDMSLGGGGYVVIFLIIFRKKVDVV